MKSNIISSATIAIMMGIFLVAGCTTQSPGGSQNGGGNGGGGTGGGQTHSVDINNFAFSPADLSIHAGDTVVWTNSDSAPHTITSDSGSEVSSSQLATGQTYSHTFSTAGTYAYHCTLHTSMKGTVTVS